MKVSRDPQFAQKPEDIVGPYVNPPEHALVLCYDERRAKCKRWIQVRATGVEDYLAANPQRSAVHSSRVQATTPAGY